MQAGCTGWGRELDSPSTGRDFGKKLKQRKSWRRSGTRRGSGKKGCATLSTF